MGLPSEVITSQQEATGRGQGDVMGKGRSLFRRLVSLGQFRDGDSRTLSLIRPSERRSLCPLASSENQIQAGQFDKYVPAISSVRPSFFSLLSLLSFRNGVPAHLPLSPGAKTTASTHLREGFQDAAHNSDICRHYQSDL